MTSRFFPLCLFCLFCLALGIATGLSAAETPSSDRESPCKAASRWDDGTVESGYGFVPSASMGTYVQKFSSEPTGGFLTGACFCFLKTRPDQDIEFEVVVYDEVDGRPSNEPLAVIAASQRGVAKSKQTAGEFVYIPLPSIPLPANAFFLGARWDPSQESYLFLCNDQSPGPDPKSSVFFAEDRAPSWTSVEDAKDPIFRPHRAVMVRAIVSDELRELAPAASAPPTPGSTGH